MHVDNVTKSYGTRQILTDVYVSCQKGEIIGLLGRNGSGKSTLLKIIFGSITADSKFIKIGERKLNSLSHNKKLINYLPQDSFLPNHLKVKNLINFFCTKSNAELIKTHELVVPILNKKSKELSGGERRLLEILLITHSESTYTLIDEPFNGIAPIYKKDIKALIKSQSKDKGFIITDHDYRNILDIATRLILVHDGGTKEIKSEKDLIKWGYIPMTESEDDTIKSII